MRQHMNRRGVGAAIDRRDAAQYVLGTRLGIFDEHVEVAIGEERLLQRVEQLVFRLRLIRVGH